MFDMETKPQIIPNNFIQREILRNKGQFWTPQWVALPMVQYVIKNTKLVYDPATGNGAFLQALISLQEEVNFYGTDIDDNVLKQNIYNKPSVIIERRDFIRNPPTNKFNAIVTNPPFIRHHRIDESTKEYLRQLTYKITGFTIDGRAGYHVYFLLQALNLLADNGRLAIILPADTCEGVFSKKLWKWLTQNYLLDSVITFAESASPFPELDTNAMIFLIKKQIPNDKIKWIIVKKSGDTLLNIIKSDFKSYDSCKIEVIERDINEALLNGLSRPPLKVSVSKYKLSDFATIMRGIATGANEFFFLTKKQVKQLKIPEEYFRLTIGRTRDIGGNILTLKEMDELDKNGRPTMLLYIENPLENIPKSLIDYLDIGEKSSINNRALLKLRKPWYKTEKRQVPEMLFAYLGRRNTRFIKNEIGVLPLHCLHCIYTYSKDEEQIHNLWLALNHPDTIENLLYVSKSYGSGALKAEPQNLKHLPIPEKLVVKYNLITRNCDTDGLF